jgi:hypothetical protein
MELGEELELICAGILLSHGEIKPDLPNILKECDIYFFNIGNDCDNCQYRYNCFVYLMGE